jgi:hypothetical protein
MRTSLLLLLLIAACSVSAQDSASTSKSNGTKSYKVQPGQRVGEALLHNGLYQYPAFKQAEVHYKNGSSGSGLLNYNRLTGEMQFIDAKGDTLALINEDEIATISIGKDTFYYSQGYLQQIDDFTVRFARMTMLEQTNRQRIGAYGQPNAAAVTTHTSVATNQGFKDIVPQEILTFQEKSIYYIGDRFGRFKPLNKKTLLNFYSKKEGAVSDYLKANPVNFVQEEDVMRLIGFLKTL